MIGIKQTDCFHVYERCLWLRLIREAQKSGDDLHREEVW